MRNKIVELAGKGRLCIAGIMSGTSLDGVDVAIVDVTEGGVSVKAFETIRYPAGIRKELFRLCSGDAVSVGDVASLNAILGEIFADAVINVASRSKISLKSIDMIGSHGQTIYHDSKGRRFQGRQVGVTMQIGEASVIAQRTGVTTVSDFRPSDIAVGGEGAPLVPYADFFLFGRDRVCRAIQNIGGIANVTYLPGNGKIEDVVAFDTGPGNMVIDEIVRRMSESREGFDRNGEVAGNNQVHQDLFGELMKETFFSKRPPKSTGRKLFGAKYVDRLVAIAGKMGVGYEVMVATATAVTAESIARAYRQFLPSMPDEMIVCGGGAHNRTLVSMLRERLPKVRIEPINHFGIDSDSKEAVSFAILAYATAKGIASNICSSTGAKKPVILGKIVPV
ncbi:MAG: anhydro-N-acetylmuramic acid kinase [Planctomycetota bacterium]|jgi:anhydro-N-acetylmuramic acid kinase